MKRSSKKLLLLAATLATSLDGLAGLEAGCHGGSGRRVYSSHNYVSRPVYSQPHYPQSHYSHEVISTPQPVYVHSQPEPVYASSPYASGPVSPSSVGSSPFGIQVQQGTPVGATPISSAQQVQLSQNGLSQQSVPQQSVPQQFLSSPSGLQQPAPQQVGTFGASGNVAGSPSTLTQGVPAATLADATTAAELSALQALGGFAPPQGESTAAAQQPQTVPAAAPSYIGSWTANMANGARVQLTLNAEGTFHWSAVNSSGNASTFQGNFQFDGTTLTLNRSNDNQKLTGAMTFTSAETFNFKLSDGQAGNLAFTRS